MATAQELREALDGYISQANANPRVQKTMRGWSCVIQFRAADLGVTYTVTITDGRAASVQEGVHGQADLIVEGQSEDFADVFWGDSNPASQYMNAAIKVQGPSDHVMRLDAMAMLVYLKE